MSRLLHAAARGARIQRLMQHPHRWENYQLVAPLRDSSEDRIHPDDAHLQYGPISTALRGAAAQDFSIYEEHRKVYTYAAFEMADTYETSWQQKYEHDNQRVLFLLILAEALADEGL